MRKSITFFMVLFLFISCGGKEKKDNNSRTTNEKNMGKEKSVAITYKAHCITERKDLMNHWTSDKKIAENTNDHHKRRYSTQLKRKH